ncbi:MAG TPA: methyl-accepting chemotaxis protein [Chromobacteriaceae bacterium]|nr:methyl-accepting chemotaxis protein [Chromobacteriaceae bacterium]
MKISQRLLLTLSTALVALLAVGAFGLWQLKQANTRFDYIAENTMPSVLALDHVKDTFAEMRVQVYRHVLANNPELKQKEEQLIRESDQKLASELNDYEKNLISNQEDRDLLAKDLATLKAYEAGRVKLLQLSNANQQAEALNYLMQGSLSTLAREMREAIDAHSKFNYNQAKTMTADNHAAYELAFKSCLGAMVLALIVTGVMAMRLFSSLRSSLDGISSTLVSVKDTLNFKQRAPVERMDEVGLTATAFNELLSTLQKSFGEIRSSVGNIDHSMSEMSSNAGEIAKSSVHQSEAASSMAAAVEQMTVSINHVADRAQEASQQTRDAGQIAEEGSKVVLTTVEGITTIASSIREAADRISLLRDDSETIASVLGVIKDIADQTNLLALNAAIEAARAGEMGRGFAVVADEVRKLAERTASSTTEISSVIAKMKQGTNDAVGSMQQVVERVTREADCAREASDAIDRIQRNTQRAMELVQDISDSIVEQSSASQTIAQNVEQIAQMAEENSAASSSSADAAKQLHQQARQILTTVSQYQV